MDTIGVRKSGNTERHLPVGERELVPEVFVEATGNRQVVGGVGEVMSSAQSSALQSG